VCNVKTERGQSCLTRYPLHDEHYSCSKHIVSLDGRDSLHPPRFTFKLHQIGLRLPRSTNLSFRILYYFLVKLSYIRTCRIKEQKVILQNLCNPWLMIIKQKSNKSVLYNRR